MGLFDFLWRLLGGSPRGSRPTASPYHTTPAGKDESLPDSSEHPVAETHSSLSDSSESGRAGPSEKVPQPRQKKSRRLREHHEPVVLEPLEYQPSLIPSRPEQELVRKKPYRFASIGPRSGEFLDLSQDSDQRWLEYYGLPMLRTPDDLADWLQIPIGKLAWLTHRTSRSCLPETVHKSHYFYKWVPKRSGGWRLIEAPKVELKQAQQRVLRGILDHVPAHSAAHGFVRGRSILSNATPHVGQRFVIKFDLTDFYTNVRYSRVVAIYRSLGYSREVAIWLARLTTSALPWDAKSPLKKVQLSPYTARHLPQGAATSPALANLSAFGLDVRLAGLARAYGLKYTRYADDLTFSGGGKSIPALHEIIPLIRKIIRSERFFINSKKCRVLRDGQRQVVAGVVVNEKLNMSRVEFDRLKATLHNCVRHGPSTQNRQEHPHFAEHLRGRIAHLSQLNLQRGNQLLAIYERIDWSK